MSESTFSSTPASAPTFEVILSGEIIGQKPMLQVQKSLADLFKMPEQKVAALFVAGNVTLKKGLDFDAAQRYKAAIEKTGARVLVRSSKVAVNPPVAVATAVPVKAEQVPAAVEPSTAWTLGVAGANLLAPNDRKQPVSATVTAGDWALSATGQNLLAPNETVKQVSRLDEFANFELRPAGVTLLDPDELSRLPVIELAVEDFGLAPAGADVLKPEERKAPVAASVQPGNWGVAPAGERLSEPSISSAVAPNVAHLSVADLQK